MQCWTRLLDGYYLAVALFCGRVRHHKHRGGLEHGHPYDHIIALSLSLQVQSSGKLSIPTQYHPTYTEGINILNLQEEEINKVYMVRGVLSGCLK